MQQVEEIERPVGRARNQPAKNRNEIVKDPEAVDQLHDMFPTVDRETIEDFYQM